MLIVRSKIHSTNIITYAYSRERLSVVCTLYFYVWETYIIISCNNNFT